jgi:hypothetical protein
MTTRRRKFRDGNERMAYITLEFLTGKTQVALAEELGLSHQRIHQIAKAGLARAGCKEGDPVEKVAAGFRAAFQRYWYEADMIEDFTKNELAFRGRFRRWES